MKGDGFVAGLRIPLRPIEYNISHNDELDVGICIFSLVLVSVVGVQSI